jgi:uncharacterized membrane protein
VKAQGASLRARRRDPRRARSDAPYHMSETCGVGRLCIVKVLLCALICLGLLACADLTSRYIQLATDANQPGKDLCSAVFGTGCDETLRSPLARQLGLPVAGWGIVYYAVLASLLLTGWLIGPPFQSQAGVAALFLALAGGRASFGGITTPWRRRPSTRWHIRSHISPRN